MDFPHSKTARSPPNSSLSITHQHLRVEEEVGPSPIDPVHPGMVAAHLHNHRKVVSAERVCCAIS